LCTSSPHEFLNAHKETLKMLRGTQASSIITGSMFPENMSAKILNKYMIWLEQVTGKYIMILFCTRLHDTLNMDTVQFLMHRWLQK